LKYFYKIVISEKTVYSCNEKSWITYGGKDSGHEQTEIHVVWFGLLIHLNLEGNFQFYLLGEGFIEELMEMRKFELLG